MEQFAVKYMEAAGYDEDILFSPHLLPKGLHFLEQESFESIFAVDLVEWNNQSHEGGRRRWSEDGN